MDITNILKEKGISKAELAERLGIFSQNVNKMLINPTEATIKKIADAIGVPMWQLFASREEVLRKNRNEATGVCPHCGKPIFIDLH